MNFIFALLVGTISTVLVVPKPLEKRVICPLNPQDPGCCKQFAQINGKMYPLDYDPVRKICIWPKEYVEIHGSGVNQYPATSTGSSWATAQKIEIAGDYASPSSTAYKPTPSVAVVTSSIVVIVTDVIPVPSSTATAVGTDGVIVPVPVPGPNVPVTVVSILTQPEAAPTVTSSTSGPTAVVVGVAVVTAVIPTPVSNTGTNISIVEIPPTDFVYASNTTVGISTFARATTTLDSIDRALGAGSTTRRNSESSTLLISFFVTVSAILLSLILVAF